MIPRDLHFADPTALIHLLWIIPLLACVFWAMRRNAIDLSRLIQPTLIPLIANTPRSLQRTIRMLSGLLGWILIVIALMRPQGNEHYLFAQPQTTKSAVSQAAPLDIFLLIDTSQSMGVKDARNQFARLELATAIADQLINLLPTDQIALSSVTSSLFPIIPLTYDKMYFRIMLRELHLNEGDTYGTDFQKILQKFGSEIKSLKLSRPALAVLFSDGGDNALENLQGDQLNQGLEALSQTAKAVGIPIYTVGIGTEKGGVVPGALENGKAVISKLQEKPLQTISQATAGQYFLSESFTTTQMARDLENNFNKYRINSSAFVNSDSATRSYTDYFQLPLLLGVLCLLFSWWMPSIRYLISTLMVWFFLLPYISLEANQGDQLFNSQRYSNAVNWYQEQLNGKDPLWLQDKLFFNLGTSLVAANQTSDGLTSFLYISPNGFTFPLFQERIVNNMTVAVQSPQKADAFSTLEMIFLNLHLMAALPEFDEERFSATKLSLEETNTLLGSPALLKEALASLSLIKTSDSLTEKKKTIAKSATLTALYQLHAAQAEPQEFMQKLLVLLAQIKQELLFSKTPSADLVKEAGQFYPVVLQSQTKYFQQGACPCHPWDQVLPIFSEGLALASQSLSDFTADVYVKWSRALALISSTPPSQPSEDKNDKTLNELEQMEMLDKAPRKAPAQGEGIPW